MSAEPTPVALPSAPQPTSQQTAIQPKKPVIYGSSWDSIGPIPELTIAQFITSNPYKVDPNKVIIIDGNGTRRLTHADYCNDIKAAASGLRNLFSTLERGDIVAIVSTNTLDMPSLAIGVTGAGCVPAMINPAATPPELVHSFNLVEPLGPKVMFVHPNLIDGVRKAIKLANYKRTPIIVSMLPSRATQYTLADVQASGRKSPRPLAALIKPAKYTLGMVFYSSGTTGAFKGVMLSHRNLVSNGMQIVKANPDQFGPNQVHVSFLALYHSYGLAAVMSTPPLTGTTVVHLEKYDFKKYLQAIQDHKGTRLNIVPPVALSLAKDPLVEKYDLSSLQNLSIGAAPTKLELVNLLRKKLGVKITQTYGLTETSPGSHTLGGEFEHHNGSVGRLIPDMECRLIDDEGNDVGPNEEGQASSLFISSLVILLRGPNIMMGYIRNPEATASTIQDGWLHTGDIGRRTPEGFYWIVDRLKELIKVRGFQVAPAELEGILLSHPKIRDCAVKGVYDGDKATEFPRAFLVVDPQFRNQATADEVRNWVDGQVTYYKKLNGGIFFLDEIPKNASGKILRRLLPKDPAPPLPSAKL
ncbi:acetyl-CoA synthetase-like protein [Meredithblackwellia eburnea MCA 4105]